VVVVEVLFADTRNVRLNHEVARDTVDCLVAGVEEWLVPVVVVAAALDG